jgi:hypothetical protein
VSDAEQKEALREATKRLRIAEEKVQLVRKLIPFLHHAIDEYHSHSQPLGDHLSGGFERSVLGLERMIGSLESYLALRAPTAPRLDSAESTGPATATGGSSTTGEAPEAPAGGSTAADGAKVDSAVPAGNVAPAGENIVSGRVS